MHRCRAALCRCFKPYVSTPRTHGVFLIDTATNRIGGSFDVASTPEGIALSPDGKILDTATALERHFSGTYSVVFGGVEAFIFQRLVRRIQTEFSNLFIK